jgi:glucosyl-dolichyl phosphate glucuronosyltransferase
MGLAAHDDLPMRLDLLIPTFRRPLLLRVTLESIARAERPRCMDVRVLVLNNDRSAELPGLDDVLRAIPYPTQLIHEPTPGKSSALNTALSASDADFVGLIDDDETIDPRWFRVVEDALAGSGLDFIGGRSMAAWTDTPPDWVPAGYPAVLGISDVGDEPRAYGPEFPGMLSGGNAVIARATLDRIGRFTSSLGPRAHRRLFSCEDEDLYLRLIESGARGRYVPDLIVRHRVHPERLRKGYYRAWAFWNGASKGVLSLRRPAAVPKIAGVPRFLFGEAARGLLRWAKLMVGRGAPADRFAAELPAWHLAGHLYGRHMPELASGSGARTEGSPVSETPVATL